MQFSHGLFCCNVGIFEDGVLECWSNEDFGLRIWESIGHRVWSIE
jgi:hypothetical protein